MNDEAKKQLLRAVPYGVFALGVRSSAEGGGAGHATAVSWVTQVSFEPPMIAVAVERESATLPLLRAARAFVLSALPAGARATASRLGRSTATTPRKLAGVAHRPSPVCGAPVPDEATGWLECEVRGEVATGDHVLVVAEVVEAGLSPRGAGAGEMLSLRETGFRYAG